MTWTALASAAALPPLEPGAVHLVHLPLGQAAAAAPRVEALLGAEERARAARFAFAHHRDPYVLARGTLRALLGALLGLAPAALRLVEGPFGKPALGAGHPGDLRFNLSHSGSHALLAFAQGRELGVDLEQARDEVDVSGVAGLVFSPEEQRAFAALPAPARRAAFFQLWARKEALIKAEGTGFAEPSSAFTLTVDPGAPPRLLAHTARPEAVGRWSLCDLDLAPLGIAGYGAALVCEGPPPLLHRWRLEG